ncbi:MAG: tRNA (adenosine(37)-N6)-threonylcarbamoyltransferase complex transferase subunit TsaD [bacterium]
MLILGIETSCDETAASVVENGKHVRSNVVGTQIDIHKKFGGVVPELASRAHIELISHVIWEALDKADCKLSEIGTVAVTNSPGLANALLVGTETAKALSFSLSIPLIAVNHIHAHLYANFMEEQSSIVCPVVGLVISGGHTAVFYVEKSNNYVLLGQTYDDAAGEALDKVAKMLNLGYPGGPVISKMAEKGSSKAINFPRAFLGKDIYNFSFSGMKTAVARYLECNSYRNLADVNDICAGFQQSVIDVLIKKIVNAAEQKDVKTILIGGGVSANTEFRKQLSEICKEKGMNLFYPSLKLCTDNAAMIAGLAYHRYKEGKFEDLLLDIHPQLQV